MLSKIEEWQKYGKTVAVAAILIVGAALFWRILTLGPCTKLFFVAPEEVVLNLRENNNSMFGPIGTARDITVGATGHAMVDGERLDVSRFALWDALVTYEQIPPEGFDQVAWDSHSYPDRLSITCGSHTRSAKVTNELRAGAELLKIRAELLVAIE